MTIDFFSEVVTVIDALSINEMETWLKWHLNLMRFDRAVLFDFSRSGSSRSVCDKYGDRVEYHKFDFCVSEEQRIGWLNGGAFQKQAKFSVFVPFEKFLMFPENGVVINKHLKLLLENQKILSFGGIIYPSDVQLGLYEKNDSRALKSIIEYEKRLSLIINSYQREFPGRTFNCINPRFFTEKMYWLKVYDDTMAKTACADKLKVGEYCKTKIGVDITIPKLAVYDDCKKINLSYLPESFVIKCNHGSSMNFVVDDKKKINWNKLKLDLDRWMKTDWSLYGQEFFYSRIKRKIFVEPLLDFGDSPAVDYKFWCFNGEPKFFTINGSVSKKRYSINYYDLNGVLMDVCNPAHPSDPNLKFQMPDKLSEMKDLAVRLSSDFIFVRVDFYLCEGQIYLGELTFIPGAGKCHWTNLNTDIEFGKWLDITERKKYLNTEKVLDNQ